MIPEIAYYLAVNYGTGAPAEAPAPSQLPPPSEMSVEKMATIYGCLACHKQDVKVVGPAYKDVRAKYLHDPDAIEKIMGQIRHGGTGKWGTAVMPPFTAVGDADAKRLAEWIMAGDK
jgi:cytochrome c